MPPSEIKRFTPPIPPTRCALPLRARYIEGVRSPTTFQIRSTSNEVLFVEITDVTGKIIRTATFAALATVDLSDVASGVYNVIVSNQTERAVHRVTVK